MERKIEFVAYLLLYKSIVGSDQLKEAYEDLDSQINQISSTEIDYTEILQNIENVEKLHFVDNLWIMKNIL